MKDENKNIDPIKIGSFIAQCRKEKKLTQDELANKFGITGQSVSKWENGKAVPDITLWSSICDFFDISVNELIYGGKLDTLNKKERIEKKEQVIIEGAIYQTKKEKKKYIRIIFILMFISFMMLLAFLSTYYLNNYNKISIYNISGRENLLLRGKVIFNPQKQTIVINEISYDDLYAGTNLEIETSKVNLKIMYKNNVIFETEVNGENNKLNYYLNQIHIEESITLSKDEYVLLKNSINDLELVINYSNKKGESHELLFDLNLEEEFSNDNLFY